jgi:hypothetical protein
VVRIDMVADIELVSRRDVAENSLVGATIGFCLIRQSSAVPIVRFHPSNQIPVELNQSLSSERFVHT